MVERIRNIQAYIEVDTNKDTYALEVEADNLPEIRTRIAEFIDSFGDKAAAEVNSGGGEWTFRQGGGTARPIRESLFERGREIRLALDAYDRATGRRGRC